MHPRWRGTASTRARQRSGLLAAFLAVACSSKRDEAPASASVAPTSSVVVDRFEDEALVAKVPPRVDDMADAIPATAPFAVVVPSADALDLPAELLQFLKHKLVEQAARLGGIDRRLLDAAVDQFDAAAIFGLGEAAEDLPLAIALRFRDGTSIENAIAEVGDATRIGAHTWELENNGKKHRFTWVASAKILVGSGDENALNAALDALSKNTPSFASSASYQGPHDPKRVFTFGDLHRLYRNDHFYGEGALVAGTLGLVASDLLLSLRGDRTPKVAATIAPHAHDALANLPANASVAVDLSVRRQTGKTLRDLLVEADRAYPEGAMLASTERTLRELGITFAQLESMVGDSLSVGAYTPEKVDPSEPTAAVGLVAMVSIADDALARALIATAKEKLKGSPISWDGEVARLDLGPGWHVRIDPEKGRLVVTMGTRAVVEDLAAKRATAPLLGTTPQYADYRKLAAPSSHIGIFTDGARLSAFLDKFPFSFGLDAASGGDISFEDQAAGTDVRIRGAAALAVLGGTFAFVASRNRVPISKTNEARQSVGALARAAAAAFERAHVLCKSTSNAVPVSIPVKGRKYAPQFKAGADFQTGDELTGWKCLKFSVTSPTYYRYDYRAGGGYKCVARGGVDPGPDGFEASAEGDLDGDGAVSLFCATGKIVKGNLVLDPALFTADELE